MKNFVSELLTNRFGIVLAALNLCYLAALKNINGFFDQIMLAVNFPGVLTAILSDKIIKMLFGEFHPIAGGKVLTIKVLFLVAFQWLFIGWAAKKIAKMMR